MMYDELTKLGGQDQSARKIFIHDSAHVGSPDGNLHTSRNKEFVSPNLEQIPCSLTITVVKNAGEKCRQPAFL